MDRQDARRLEEILKFCDKILRSLEKHNQDYEEFVQNNDFYDSICMKIFQIGEISTKLLSAVQAADRASCLLA